MSEKIRIDFKLKGYLDSINVTPYMLGKWVTGVSPQTIYAVANGSRRPSFEVLEAILNGLRANGYATTLTDIIDITNY